MNSIPIHSDAEPQQQITMINDNFIKIDQKLRSNVIKDEKGQTTLITGLLPNGLYGSLYYLNGVPHIIITGGTAMVAAEEGVDVLTLV